MKKTVIVLAMALVLLSAGSAFAIDMSKFTGALKVGVDFLGNWDIDSPLGGGDLDTDTGVSIAAEGYYKVHPNIDVGAGVQYLFEREIDTSPGWEFWFLPIYAAARVHPEMTDYTPYGILQLGYSFHGGNSAYFNGLDTGGGFYWGAGGGFIFKRHFLVEILYSEARGEGEATPGADVDVTHRRVTASVGYNF